MSKKTKSENPEKVEKAKRPKAAAKRGRRKASSKDKAATPAFDFVGRVESIRATSNPSGPEFEFALHGRKGPSQSFRLNPEHGAAVMTMAHVVIAAHDNDAKIGVRTAQGGKGLPVVAEVVWRPKIGKAG